MQGSRLQILKKVKKKKKNLLGVKITCPGTHSILKWVVGYLDQNFSWVLPRLFKKMPTYSYNFKCL